MRLVLFIRLLYFVLFDLYVFGLIETFTWLKSPKGMDRCSEIRKGHSTGQHACHNLTLADTILVDSRGWGARDGLGV